MEETTTTKLCTSLLPLPTLPFDILIEILCRLPVKLLSQLRCVCKSFDSLISDSKFAKKHLRFSTTLHRLSIRNGSEFVLFDTPIPSDFLTSRTTITQSQINFPNSLKIGSAFPRYVSSCDGILCFTMSQGSAVLWNPSIRKFKILSFLSFNNAWSRGQLMSAYTFGYDHFIHNYKIFAISVSKDKSQVYVHTLGGTDHDWRRIDDFPYYGPRGPGIFVSGTVNWLTVEDVRRSTSRVIVSLDLKKETYQKLSQPDLDHYSWNLGVSRDCLCIFAKSTRFLEVWIMNEYGNKESWTKLYRVPHRKDQGLCSYKNETKLYYDHYLVDRGLHSFKNALYISKNDQLLMDFFELNESGGFTKIKLVVHHSKTGTLKIADIENFRHWIDPHVYIESLISPCS